MTAGVAGCESTGGGGGQEQKTNQNDQKGVNIQVKTFRPCVRPGQIKPAPPQLQPQLASSRCFNLWRNFQEIPATVSTCPKHARMHRRTPNATKTMILRQGDESRRQERRLMRTKSTDLSLNSIKCCYFLSHFSCGGENKKQTKERESTERVTAGA